MATRTRIVERDSGAGRVLYLGEGGEVSYRISVAEKSVDGEPVEWQGSGTIDAALRLVTRIYAGADSAVLQLRDGRRVEIHVVELGRPARFKATGSIRDEPARQD